MRESFHAKPQEAPKKEAGVVLSPVAKVLAEKLSRRSVTIQQLMVIAGLQAGIQVGVVKLTESRMSSRLQESHAPAHFSQEISAEQLRRLNELYGQDMLRRLQESVRQGEDARLARGYLPEGQPAQLRVQHFEPLGYHDATLQRFFTTMYPQEMSSSTTILSVTRTDRQIPMGYGMVGYEGGHCTRSLRNGAEAARGSEIVITPDGFPSENSLSPTRVFAHVLLHEGAHANDPFDSPDMPERLRVEAMMWLGERVVRMDERSRHTLDVETPAGQGFLRFTYPMRIATQNREQRNEDRAVEYWAELISTVQALTPEPQMSGVASTWEERTARQLALNIGSGIQDRSQDRLFADALEHVRFLRRVLPEMNWEERQRQYRDQERTLARERIDRLAEEQVFSRIQSPELRQLLRQEMEHPHVRDTDLEILSITDPDSIGAEYSGERDVLFVRPDARLPAEDLELRQAARWAAEARQREFEAITHLLAAEDRHWIEAEWPRILSDVKSMGQSRDAGFEFRVNAEWPRWLSSLNAHALHPGVREVLERLVEWRNQEAIGPSAMPAAHREQVERVLRRMHADPEYLRNHVILVPDGA